MNLTDLMIGDWVSNKDKTIIRRIDDIDSAKNRVVLGDHTIDANFIYPVPLTSEILEKNGWYLVESISSYRNRDNSFWIGDRNNPFGILISNIYQNINYVHELQHLLKVCKIEKEIIL